jgi:sortase A
MRRFFSSLLLFLAGVAIGVWLWSRARQAIDQRRDEQTFDRERDSPEQTAPTAQKRTAPAAHGEVVGRLLIRRIHLRAMVREGDDEGTLDVALGHIPGTAFPGQTGNVGVAGHRDTLFRRLREIGRNDEIELQTRSSTYAYKVDDIAIVKPDTVSVLAPGRRDQLTLVTCYPFRYVGSAPERYIVKAHLVSQTPLGSSPAISGE